MTNGPRVWEFSLVDSLVGDEKGECLTVNFILIVKHLLVPTTSTMENPRGTPTL